MQLLTLKLLQLMDYPHPIKQKGSTSSIPIHRHIEYDRGKYPFCSRRDKPFGTTTCQDVLGDWHVHWVIEDDEPSHHGKLDKSPLLPPPDAMMIVQTIGMINQSLIEDDLPANMAF